LRFFLELELLPCLAHTRKDLAVLTVILAAVIIKKTDIAMYDFIAVWATDIFLEQEVLTLIGVEIHNRNRCPLLAHEMLFVYLTRSFVEEHAVTTSQAPEHDPYMIFRCHVFKPLFDRSHAIETLLFCTGTVLQTSVAVRQAYS
jgi:hypothetical protein